MSRLGIRAASWSDQYESTLRQIDALDGYSANPSSQIERSKDPRGMLAGFEAGSGKRLTCAFDGCTAGWSRILKRRARPVFEGAWGCSRGCIRALVDSVVRSEMKGAQNVNAEAHQHRLPLGLMLLAQGLVTQIQLRTALEAQKFAGHGRIGHWLVEAAGVSERKVTRGLGMQWQCPVLDLLGFDAPRMALAMPAALRRMCRAVPIRVAGETSLYLGFDESVDAAAAFALERMSGLTIESGVLSSMDFARGMEKLDRSHSVSCREEDMADHDEMADRMVDALQRLQPVASKMVRLRDHYWLRMCLERGSLSKNGSLPVSNTDVVDVLYRLKV